MLSDLKAWLSVLGNIRNSHIWEILKPLTTISKSAKLVFSRSIHLYDDNIGLSWDEPCLFNFKGKLYIKIAVQK